LQDFRSGARVSETMSPLMKDLDDKQIADLAVYYGRLFRGAIDPAESGRYVGSTSRTSSPTVMSPAVCHHVRPVTRSSPATRSRPQP
jgi:hypothetical protein